MTILCYHEVDPDWNGPLGISPQEFARHCSWLRNNRSVVDLVSALKVVRSTGRLPGGMVTVTFDDGLAGLYAHATPILLQHRIPATMFLVSQTLTPEGKGVDWIDGKDPSTLQTLTVDQVLEMQDAGISFQSHSHSHSDLRTLGDDELRRDLKESKDLLESILHREVWCLAYPRGLHDERVRAAARSTGFSHALGLAYGGPAKDRWGIPRAGVYAGNGTIALRIKTSPWYPSLRRSRPFSVMRRTVGRSSAPDVAS